MSQGRLDRKAGFGQFASLSRVCDPEAHELALENCFDMHTLFVYKYHSLSTSKDEQIGLTRKHFERYKNADKFSRPFLEANIITIRFFN